MKKFQIVSLTLAAALLLAGCGATSAAESTVPAQSESAAAAETPDTAEATPAAALPDGVYTAEFKTDSSMFHANEACEGMGTLTVADGKMVFHVSLQSQKIVNLYPGTAADAPAHEADWLQPSLDTVTYSDGTTDEVYGFDIPVKAVDTDFSLAILGTKGTWYDHTVSISDAEPAAEEPDYSVIKRKHFALKPMHVDEAILQMELLGHNFYMFLNAETEVPNVVYKRNAGGYGLLEPDEN